MPARPRSYHHGDLRTALVEAALAATRTGGPGALSLRDVTRTAGVTPAAAYRHFTDRSQLLRAVAGEIQERMGRTMRHHMRAPRDASDLERARLHLRGVGVGYVTFAREESGWFETAFFGDAGGRPADVPAEAPPPAFALLVTALDELVAAGGLEHDRRPQAEFACWAAVHGCAELLIHGPLRDADAALKRSLTERVVDDIIAGVRG